MALTAAVVTVTTTATKLSTDELDNSASSSCAVAVPTGGATVYVGPANVTAATGFPVAAGTSVALDLGLRESVYGVVASGTQAVNVLGSGI